LFISAFAPRTASGMVHIRARASSTYVRTYDLHWS